MASQRKLFPSYIYIDIFVKRKIYILMTPISLFTFQTSWINPLRVSVAEDPGSNEISTFLAWSIFKKKTVILLFFFYALLSSSCILYVVIYFYIFSILY